MATPALLFVDLQPTTWSLPAILSVVGLGIGPTGIAAVLIIIIIRRTGAGFMALANYITPLWAIALGALIFHERLQPNAFIALAIILVGVAIAQWTPRRQRLKNSLAASCSDPISITTATQENETP